MNEIKEYGLGGPKTRIGFKFRCSAFGVNYYDCRWLDSNCNPHTAEVCFKDGFIESHPVLTYNYEVRIDDPELLEAWREFCAAKRAEYLQWLEDHPECKEFSKLAPFRL